MKGRPTPVPAGGYETPSAGINWKLFLLVAGIIGIAFFAGMAMQSDGDSAPADVNSPSAYIGQDIKPNNPPVAVETETLDAKPTASGLKLLRKEGPFIFPNHDERTEIGSIVPQKTEFEVNGFQVYAIASSSQEPFVRLTPVGMHSGSEKFIVLIVLRDGHGNIEKSLCKVDEETGSYYYSKFDFSQGVPEYALSVSERGINGKKIVSKIYSWEVLAYA